MGCIVLKEPEKDYRNDIGPVTRGNNVKRIGTLSRGVMH